MAKFELKFIDVINPDFKLEITKSIYDTNDDFDVKVIDIIIHEKGNDDPVSFSMDISTAIKVAKTLRTEINKLKESEVNNG